MKLAPVVVLLLGSALAPSALAQSIKVPEPAVTGPTLGHVSSDEAWLWLHAPGVRSVKIEGAGAARDVPVQGVGRGYGKLVVDGLKAETRYELVATVRGQAPVKLSFRTAAAPRDWGKLRFLVGSCANTAEQPVWANAEKRKADLFLFLGDNVYYGRRGPRGVKNVPGDWDRLDWMLARQQRQRSRKTLLSLMRSTPTYSTWDDHDYGPNNSDGSFPLKAESRLVHKYLWAANPGFGRKERGVYFSFRRGPVEFFVLDGRSFKDVDPERKLAERELFGKEQLAWLRTGLEFSTAPLKIIAAGTQFLLGYPLAEGWQEAPTEKAAFLGWLAKAKLGPVVFLSGDIHVSELYTLRLGKNKRGPESYELTSSGLAASAFGFEDVFTMALRPERKWVEVKPNMCEVEIEIPKAKAKRGSSSITFRSLSSADGSLLKETKLPFPSQERLGER